MYYLVQLVVSRNDAPPYLRDGLYLAQAPDAASLDGLAKALVAKHLTATDYLHKAMPEDFAPPPAVQLGNPDSIPLGVDISWTDDMNKVDWDAWRKKRDDDQGE